jgi:membrane protein YqaA with SNARE-associated domain
VFTWLLVTLGVAFLAALFPLLSVEIYTVGLVLKHPEIPWWLIGLVIAVGQFGGKLVYYYAGRGHVRLPQFLHRKATAATSAADLAKPPPQGWRRYWHRVWMWVRGAWFWLRDKCHAHPYWMLGALACSSLVGLPPFAATAVLAGLAGLSLRSFALGVIPGRFLRFSLIAASPMMVKHWHWHWHWLHWLHIHLPFISH